MRTSTRIYRKIIHAIVPARVIGWYDFTFRKEKFLDLWGGPLNGQRGRQQAVREMFGQIHFSAVVETGTFRGSSTAFFHEVGGCPVWSVEKESRFATFARLRFRKEEEIHIHCGDSRDFLQDLIAADSISQDARFFFYLDAHWEADLPLLAELDLIHAHWPNAVVLVDDFQVPDDEGYKFDRYQEAGSLDLDLVAQARGEKPTCFFPAMASCEESGSRSGSVVLTWNDDLAREIQNCPSLRQWSW